MKPEKGTAIISLSQYDEYMRLKSKSDKRIEELEKEHSEVLKLKDARIEYLESGIPIVKRDDLGLSLCLGVITRVIDSKEESAYDTIKGLIDTNNSLTEKIRNIYDRGIFARLFNRRVK